MHYRFRSQSGSKRTAGMCHTNSAGFVRYAVLVFSISDELDLNSNLAAWPCVRGFVASALL